MRRFYKDVGMRKVDDGWQVMLDDRPLKTQRGAPQIVPGAALADLLAGEWREQGEELDTRRFVLRNLADFAIDIVSPDRDAAIDKLLQYAATDTLCYRADPDEPLWRRQQELWEPMVTACEARHAIQLERISGIVHRQQPEISLAALRRRLESEDDFTLAALTTMASLAASLVVPLALLDNPETDPAALFAAANAEEDWQAELWGWDFEAEKTRASRLEAFEKAAQFARALD